MVILGGTGIVSTFMNLGLIDEYRLLVQPMVSEKGKPLFKDLNKRHQLNLIKTKTFHSGVVILYYLPAFPAAE